MIERLLPLLLCLLALPACGSLDGLNGVDEPSVAPGANDRYATEEGRATAFQIFEGEGREQYQRPDDAGTWR